MQRQRRCFRRAAAGPPSAAATTIFVFVSTDSSGKTPPVYLYFLRLKVILFWLWLMKMMMVWGCLNSKEFLCLIIGFKASLHKFNFVVLNRSLYHQRIKMVKLQLQMI
ncbi:hypothetical protein HanHA300_Chr08g0277381 [Helianthus annuus]|nr:hypothetical protein HanHA300_Chr08g0277381 [Helianthus annuus]